MFAGRAGNASGPATLPPLPLLSPTPAPHSSSNPTKEPAHGTPSGVFAEAVLPLHEGAHFPPLASERADQAEAPAAALRHHHRSSGPTKRPNEMLLHPLPHQRLAREESLPPHQRPAATVTHQPRLSTQIGYARLVKRGLLVPLSHRPQTVVGKCSLRQMSSTSSTSTGGAAGPTLRHQTTPWRTTCKRFRR